MSAPKHTKAEILALMDNIPVTAVATTAGDTLRTRMMHYAADDNLSVYLSSMKGDPKTVQLTNQPSISLLVHDPGKEITDSKEVEITGKAVFVRDPEERERALKLTAARSPVVKYLTESGNSGMLDCIKIIPEVVKFRIFNEIVQGNPPTVFEFPENRRVVSDWQQIKRKIGNWKTEIRIPFLTASLVPVLLGTAIAWSAVKTVNWGLFLLTMLAGLLIHIGTNIINDYSDHKSGNDDANQEFVRPFSGGSRVIQLGLLSPLEVLTGAITAFLLSGAIGFYLAWVSGPFILVLGGIGLLSGIFYTGGALNWTKKGIGEIVIGLNFGVLMTLGAYYVQTETFNWLPVIASIPLAILIAAVLYINEFPDYNADKKVGKKTLVVRLGKQKAVTFYGFLMAGVYLTIIAGVILSYIPVAGLIGLLTIPLAIRALLHARKNYANSFDMVPANALTVITHLSTGLLLTLAFVWDALGTQGLTYVLIMGVVFIGFVIWMYRYIENQKNVFHGLKQAVSQH